MTGCLTPARRHRLVAAALWSMVAIPAAAGDAASARTCPADLVAGPGRMLVFPPVAGATGPFAKVRVTLIGSDGLAGPFTGRLDIPGGQCFVLLGPADPTGLFDFFVTAIVLTPFGPGRPNGIVVLYRQIHRSPELDSFPGALAYRVDQHGAERLPALEQRLAGARSAAQVRHRTQAGR